MTLVVRSPAKLNLLLEILGRREDGYHELDSVFVALDWADTVTLERSDRTELTATGHPVPLDETNLAWRAAAALGVGARIHLDKVIPCGAGLGGGSSNAAAVLDGLCRLYDLDPGPERLASISRELGADVPFFLDTGLAGGWARCRGIGERVETLQKPPPKRFLLLLPDLSVATPDVYRALDPGLTGNSQTATVFLEHYRAEIGPAPAPYANALQEPAERIEPRLARLRQAAEAAYGARFHMTGSGAAYFCEIGPWVRDGVEFEGTAELAASVRVVATGSR